MKEILKLQEDNQLQLKVCLGLLNTDPQEDFSYSLKDEEESLQYLQQIQQSQDTLQTLNSQVSELLKEITENLYFQKQNQSLTLSSEHFKQDLQQYWT